MSRLSSLLIIMITFVGCVNDAARWIGTDRSKLRVAGGAWNPSAADGRFAASEADFEMEEEVPESSQSSPEQINRADKKLIKTGYFKMKVDNLKKAQGEVLAITSRLKGYTASESLNNYGGYSEMTQTIRVPAESYDSLVIYIGRLADKVENSSTNIDDVTAEYLDVSARLETKKALESRYREILRDAKRVEDLLAIETQIANVRGEIESMEGRLKYMSNQVQFSTLTLVYYESLGTDFGFGGKVGNAFSNGWDAFLMFLVGVVASWPFLILIGCAVWLFVRWRRNRRQASVK